MFAFLRGKYRLPFTTVPVALVMSPGRPNERVPIHLCVLGIEPYTITLANDSEFNVANRKD